MSLIRPQGKNRKVRKTAIKIIYLEGMVDIFDDIKADGNTPHYFLFDPKDEEAIYLDTKPFTLEQARKVYKEEVGEDE